VLAARALTGKLSGSETEAKRNVVEAIRAVAGRLGNTAAICRKCYVHPGVVDAYLGGTLDRIVRRSDQARPVTGLDADERAVLPLLRTCARRQGRSATRATRRAAFPARASG
jgi:DNA topoisomerase I